MLKWLRNKWPWISKKLYEEKIVKLREEHRQRLNLVESELNEERKKIQEILKRYVRIGIKRESQNRQFQIITRIDEEMAYCVAPGDMDQMRYLARMVGYRVEAEIGSMNMRMISDLNELDCKWPDLPR